MSGELVRTRFWARIQVRHVPGATDWSGVQVGFRSSVVLAEDHHTSIVLACENLIGPGAEGCVELEMISSSPSALRVGQTFELRSGITVAARGVVETIESIE